MHGTTNHEIALANYHAALSSAEWHLSEWARYFGDGLYGAADNQRKTRRNAQKRARYWLKKAATLRARS